MREEVEEMLRKELLEPLAKYYEGVSLLFTGRFEEASTVLQEAAEFLPDGYSGSMVFTFLAMAEKKGLP